MVCRGTVRQGRVELECGASLPEGAAVRVETLSTVAQQDPHQPAAEESEALREQRRAEWLEDWRKFAQEMTTIWPSPESALDTLSEMRR